MIDHQALTTARTFLFVPGNRPERFDRSAQSGADVVIVDLEDAVAPEDKDGARRAISEWFARGGQAVIRVNAIGTPWHAADVDLAAEMSAPVMLAKATDGAQIADVADRTRAGIIPLVETAAGILAADDIARQARVARLALGHIDLAAETGVRPDDREAVLFARSKLVYACAAAGVAGPIDGVTTALRDPAVLVDNVNYATRLGMRAKLCIHPSQVAHVHKCLMPTDEEIRWARRIIAAVGTGGSAIAVDGHMVDAPVVARAHRILHAGAVEPSV